MGDSEQFKTALVGLLEISETTEPAVIVSKLQSVLAFERSAYQFTRTALAGAIASPLFPRFQSYASFQLRCVVNLMTDSDPLVQAAATTSFAALWRPVLEMIMNEANVKTDTQQLYNDWAQGVSIVSNRLNATAPIPLKNYLGCMALVKSLFLAFLPCSDEEGRGGSLAVTQQQASANNKLIQYSQLRFDTMNLFTHLKSILSSTSSAMSSSHLQITLTMLGSVAAQREYALSTFAPELIELSKMKTEGDSKIVNLCVKHTVKRVLVDLSKSYFPAAMAKLRRDIESTCHKMSSEERGYIEEELREKAAGKQAEPVRRKREVEDSYIPTLDDDDSDSDSDSESDDDDESFIRTTSDSSLNSDKPPPEKMMRMDESSRVSPGIAPAPYARSSNVPSFLLSGGQHRQLQQLPQLPTQQPENPVINKLQPEFGAPELNGPLDELEYLLPQISALQRDELVEDIMRMLSMNPLPTSINMPFVRFWDTMTSSVSYLAERLIPGWRPFQIQQPKVPVLPSEEEREVTVVKAIMPLTKEELISLRKSITENAAKSTDSIRSQMLRNEMLVRSDEFCSNNDVLKNRQLSLRVLFRSACNSIPMNDNELLYCSNQEKRYNSLLLDSARAIRAGTSSELVEFFKSVPWLPNATVDEIFKWFENRDQSYWIFAPDLLHYIILSGLSCADECLQRLKLYADPLNGKDQSLRERATHLLASLHDSGGPLAKDIEEFAKQLVIAHYGDRALTDDTIRDAEKSLLLFLEICTSSPVLLGQLFKHFKLGSDELRDAILNSCRRVLDGLKNGEERMFRSLYALLRNAILQHEVECKDLIIRFLDFMLKESNPVDDQTADSNPVKKPPALEIALEFFDQWSNSDFIIVAVPAMTQKELMDILPKVVEVSSPDQMEQFFSNIESDGKLKGPDVLMQIHKLSLPTVSSLEMLKALSKTIPICLDVFNAELNQQFMASFLQRVALMRPMPPLMMRTALHALKRYPRLKSWFLQNYMPRLLKGHINESRPLWEGFIICCTRIGVDSCPVLLRCERQLLIDLIKNDSRIRELLNVYSAKRPLPPGIKTLLEEEKKNDSEKQQQ